MRSQFKFNIARGGCWSRKVARYLRAAGLDAPIFVTEKARQRHIHPRRLRHEHWVGEYKADYSELTPEEIAAPLPANPFAQLGKKNDAPSNG